MYELCSFLTFSHSHVLIVVDCGEPPLLENGNFIVENTTANNTALYICEEGFRHKDNSLQIEIQCLPDGVWTQLDIECVAGKSICVVRE